jgi:hypothetical protein
MHGSLFTQDFLDQGIRDSAAWLTLDAMQRGAFIERLQRIYSGVGGDTQLNEAQTEAELIMPVLQALGWHLLPQQQTNARGRADVPDALLFASAEARQAALEEPRPDRRFRHGTAIVESKRWLRPLDRGNTGNRLEIDTPSSQMLRYLSQAEIASDRAVMWGLLTNGRQWRLYWQGARSRSEEFVEIDLAHLLGVTRLSADLLAAPIGDAAHALMVFYLLFRAPAFLPQPNDSEGRSFHRIALDESRHWESRVSNSLGRRVFDEVFPQLILALSAADPQRDPHSRDYREQLKRAALTLLYRLLFVLYAEDRNLLPVRDARYDDYSLRRVRDDIARRRDQGDVFSANIDRYWQHLRGLFRAIAGGDSGLGLPAYNGGLFDEAREPLLARVGLGDAVMAPLIDALSREPDARGNLRRLNYRDLSVQHLGSIYERLLEQAVALDTSQQLAVQPSSFARKASGSYYTHDDLVKLLIAESLTPLIAEQWLAFDQRFVALRAEHGPASTRRRALEAHDPAASILSLRLCDPAMGSGHFLVTAVDYLADEVLEKIASAATHVNAAAAGWDYESPVAARIRDLRGRLLANARDGGWTLDENQLDDRHIVRRMILKRVIHGADKNPMAVELAKLSLWLHTFTAGAPLSFLDHHLRCGDALCGERLGEVIGELRRRGGLFAENDLRTIGIASESLRAIGELTDVDIAKVNQSKHLMEESQKTLAPLVRLLDFWQALRWIAPLDTPPRQRGDRHAALADLLSGRFGDNLLIVLQHGATGNTIEDCAQGRRDQCAARPMPRAGGAGSVPALGTRLPHRLARTGNRHSAGRLRRDARQSAVGPSEAAAGGMVRRTPPRDRPAVARGRPHAHDPRTAGRRRSAVGRLCRGQRACRYHGQRRPRLRRLPVALRRRHQPVLAVHRARAGAGPRRWHRRAAGALGHQRRQGRVRVLPQPVHHRAARRAVRFREPESVLPGRACQLQVQRAGVRRRGAQLRFHPVHRVEDLPARTIQLGPADFAAVNPNTGTAPIFRSQRDADLTTRIYRHNPVLVDRRPQRLTPPQPAQSVWPVRYTRMFDMTNDSGLFKTEGWLIEQGGYKVAANRWKCGGQDYVPLYEGKMVQAYDHRAASVAVNPQNLHRPAQPLPATALQHADIGWLPAPQAWVTAEVPNQLIDCGWTLAFKHVTAPTNVRTMIASICPLAGYGNSLPMLVSNSAGESTLLLANLNSLVLDFVCRQKVQGQNLNLYLVEQLPLIAPARFAEPLGPGTVADLVRREVLRLSYTAHDLAPFARDLGFDGSPFVWEAEDRRHRMARLDALFFRLYGLDRDEAGYVLDTFPIVRAADEAAFGRYRTRDLVLGYMNALAAGDIDSVLVV